MTPKWYLQRLASMSPQEMAGRGRDAANRRLWRFRPPAPLPTLPSADRRGPVVPTELVGPIDGRARTDLLAEADQLLAGRWTMFGRPRHDMTADLDYFLDFVGGTRAPDRGYSLSIDHRDEAAVGTIKFVWEPARHHHLSLLAAAYALSDDEAYAERIDAELRHYWAQNPFLVGIHWTSGIELGIRLLSWTWIRRLLDRWPGASALFEDNPVFVEQLGRHLQWLHRFPSHGSSANNHLIAEAAGRFVACAAFPLFGASQRWRDDAAAVLARELEAQTFPDGLNRELASDYHGFVLELALAAWVEAVLVDHSLAQDLIGPMTRAFDALEAVVDRDGRPHRQGDSDDANGWLVDPVGYDRWTSLRSSAALVVEPASWWRPGPPSHDVRTALVQACVAGRHRPANPVGRPDRRPARFPDAGLSLLRSEASEDGRHDELWCMFDHGPLGFLATAAHGHADALAVEIRSGGVEVVVDPGTYCYHGEPVWRDHFRSTAAHATVTVADTDQSVMQGPFLWGHRAEATVERDRGLDDGPVAQVVASHDGYRRLGWHHRRSVELDRQSRTLTIEDRVEPVGPAHRSVTPVPVVVSFPLGPTVAVDLDPSTGTATLTWDRPAALGLGRAEVALDRSLSWSVVRGSRWPPAGWYSASIGHKTPTAMLIGRSPAVGTGAGFSTTITFLSGAAAPDRRTEGLPYLETLRPRTRIRGGRFGRLPGR